MRVLNLFIPALLCVTAPCIAQENIYLGAGSSDAAITVTTSSDHQACRAPGWRQGASSLKPRRAGDVVRHLRFRSHDVVWNINAPDHLDYGLQNVVIDISEDGINWAEFGQYVFPQGTGDMRYEGTEVMHFDSANARYVLITAIDNYGGSCYGLSEIRIRAHSLCVDDKQVWIAGDGDWNVATNWCSNRVPDENDKVVIPSNVTVTIPFLYTAHVWTIDLDPDAELNMVGSMVVHKKD